MNRVVNEINNESSQGELKVKEIRSLTQKIFEITLNVYNQDLRVYLIILGNYCCKEDEILGILRDLSSTSIELPIDEGEGCCKRTYKRLYNAYKDNFVASKEKVLETLYSSFIYPVLSSLSER